MPTICRPLDANLVFRSCSFGKDFLHGSQKVPQKSTSTTLPRIDLSESVPLPPTSALTLKSGAGLPTSPEESAESAPLPSSPAAPQPESATPEASESRDPVNSTACRRDVIVFIRAVLPQRLPPFL